MNRATDADLGCREAQLLIKFQREPLATQGALISEDSHTFCEVILSVLRYDRPSREG